MKIEITKKFRKQVDKSADTKTKKKLLSILEQMQKASSLSDIHHLKKLKGYKNTYRIRLGEYRIGIYVENNVVIFAAFDNRSDIYKYSVKPPYRAIAPASKTRKTLNRSNKLKSCTVSTINRTALYS